MNSPQKIRIGFGLGTRSEVRNPQELGELAENLEQLNFDSIWFSERVAGSSLDPLVLMSWIAGRTQKLKFGPSIMVLPGRNPVILAKSLASLDVISQGRLLPAFGLGAADTAEHLAFGVERQDRSPWFNEALPLMRRLWEEDRVTHAGQRFFLENVRVLPKPIQEPLEIWLGGLAPSELRRVGRLGDGWLPSFCTPEDVSAGIPIIDKHAAEAGRPIIDREHFGALIIYTHDATMPEQIKRAVENRRPDINPNQIIVQGHQGLKARVKEFTEAGASKFILVPYIEPENWKVELEKLAEAVLVLQT